MGASEQRDLVHVLTPGKALAQLQVRARRTRRSTHVALLCRPICTHVCQSLYLSLSVCLSDLSLRRSTYVCPSISMTPSINLSRAHPSTFHSLLLALPGAGRAHERADVARGRCGPLVRRAALPRLPQGAASSARAPAEPARGRIACVPCRAGRRASGSSSTAPRWPPWAARCAGPVCASVRC